MNFDAITKKWYGSTAKNCQRSIFGDMVLGRPEKTSTGLRAEIYSCRPRREVEVG